MFLVFLISELTALFTKVSENNQNSSDGCILWITGSEGRLRLPQKSKATITYHPWACLLSSAKKKKKWRTSTGTEVFSLLVCLDASKFVLLCLYTYAFRDDSPPPQNLCKTTAQECKKSTSGLLGSLKNVCQDRTRPDETRWDEMRQDRAGQDKTGQNRPRQDKTGQDRTRQDRTGQDSKGQEKTRQDRTRQDGTRWHETRQDRARRDETGWDKTNKTRQEETKL